MKPFKNVTTRGCMKATQSESNQWEADALP